MTTVYAAMEDALTVAHGTGDDWTTDQQLVDRQLECAAADDTVALVGTFESGLFRSTDGGHSWSRVGEATLPASVMSIAVSPHNASEWWVGTEPSRVFRSTDAGETWAERPGLSDLPSADDWYFPPRPDTHHVRWLEVDPHDPERLYIGIEAGALVLSDDAGETWRERPSGARRDNHQLATHPEVPGRVYAAAGDGYAESSNSGETWEHPQEGLDHRYVCSVAPAPDDADTVLVSAARGPRQAHSQPAESYVYRRTDPAGPWRRLDNVGLPTGDGVIRAELVSGFAGSEFYAANNRGVFHSTDAGDSWTRLPIEWPDRFESMACQGLAVV